MKPPKKPHDLLFKSTFSDKGIALVYLREFLSKNLSDRLDLSTLTLEPTTYVDTKLSEFFSDIIYTCNLDTIPIKVSLLFEHKSKPDGIIYLQLLRYMLEGWDRQKNRKQDLVPIIPIVVYHGKEKWNTKAFPDYFNGMNELLLPFIPSFTYHLTNLQSYTDEEILASGPSPLTNTFLLFKHHGDDLYTEMHIERLFWGTEEYIEEDSLKHHVHTFLIYLWATSELKQQDFRNLRKRLPQPIINATMTTYEQILQEGKMEGKIEGKTENENRVIINALREGLGIPFIARITELSEEEVQNRIKSLGLQG